MLTIRGNYFEKDGHFFPYLADTAWTLLQRLTRDEIIFYLDKRATQGFNAIQVSAISELDGVRVPNREGYLPFTGGDVKKPDDRYFDLVRFVADECEKRDIVLVLLPSWGDKFNQKWGLGPEIFTPDNAARYASYLASVIGARENVIWMLGGDRPVETETHREISDETAAGLRTSEQVKHLMTYHPCGEASSADYLSQSEYLDFHSIQSGHSFGGFKSERLLRRTVVTCRKPCIDAECFYEDFPIDFNLEWGYRLCGRDIRRRIYKNLLAGAAGHTYGHQSVWCFREKTDREYPYDWKTALDRPVAKQIHHVNTLLQSIDITSARPAHFAGSAAVCAGNGFALIYLENNEPAFLNLQKHLSKGECRWFDPVTGEMTDPQSYQSDKMTVVSPFGHDAVLVLTE